MWRRIFQIYKKLIKQEESATGEKSSKPHDATPAEAAADPDVKAAQLESKSHIKFKRFVTDIL